MNSTIHGPEVLNSRTIEQLRGDADKEHCTLVEAWVMSRIYQAPRESNLSPSSDNFVRYNLSLWSGYDDRILSDIVSDGMKIGSLLKNDDPGYALAWIMEKEHIVRGRRSMPPRLLSLPQPSREYPFLRAHCKLYGFATEEWCASFCGSHITSDQLSQPAKKALAHVFRVHPQATVEHHASWRFLELYRHWMLINLARHLEADELKTDDAETSDTEIDHTKISFNIGQGIRDVLDCSRACNDLSVRWGELAFQLAVTLPGVIRKFGWDAGRFFVLHALLLIIAKTAGIDRLGNNRIKQEEEKFTKLVKGKEKVGQSSGLDGVKTNAIE